MKRPSDHRIDVPNGSLCARIWDPPAKTSKLQPLVFLHDSLGCIDTWRDFPRLLSERVSRPVIAYDRLGFGRSSRRESLPSWDFIKEEGRIYLPRVMEHFGFEKYVLFGHSVGGAMALEAATHRPEISAVISESAQVFIEERTREGILKAKEAFKDPDRFAKLQHYHGDKAQWVLNAWTEIWLAHEFRDWNLTESLDKVSCPVLALHGDKDEYGSSAFPQMICEHVAGICESKVLENCGHVPHREKERDVIALLSEFLRGLP